MVLQHQDSVSTPRYGSYSKAYPVQKQSNPLLTAISWLLLLAALLLAVAVGGRTVLAWSSRDRVLYAVVIDSGSSGTRIYACNWTQPLSGGSRRSRAGSSSTDSFPVVKAIPPSAAAHLVPKHASKGMYNRVETRPGLDAFAERPSGLSGALGPLLAWAQAVVPPAQHASTPLFFMGTGGLRRLPATQQEAVLAEVRKQLGQSRFRFEPSWARVISGDDEGAFGWLALNYQQGRLRPHSHAATAAGATGVATSITSLGALDLGGSSLQITFEVPPTPSGVGRSSGGKSAAVPAARPEYNITVAGRTFHLHLHSFKQYGLNEAYDRSITHLLLQQQKQQAAIKQQQGAPQQSGNVTAAASTAPPAKPALGHGSHIGSSSSNISSVQSTPLAHDPDAALVGAAIQHDLAVARAAGVHVDNTVASTAVHAIGSAVSADAAAANTGSDPQMHSADMEQHRQADLAAAAAAGYHQHETQEAVSTAVDTNLDSLQPASSSSSSSSSSSGGTATGIDYPSSGSSNSAGAGLSSGAWQASTSHSGLQSVQNDGSAALHPAHLSTQPERSTGAWPSPGLRLQGSKQPPAAARRRASARQRRSLLQQQLLWLEQLLGTASLSSSSSGQAGSSSLFSSQLDTSSSRGHALQQHEQHEQHSHDVRLRQLLREYLLRDDPTLTATSAAASNSSSRAGVATYDSLPVAPHPVVPADTGSSSSTPAVVPVARLKRAVDSHVGSSSANSSNSLQIVRHPCLHQGFEATYTRVAYEGIIPEPAKVLLRGDPDWESCLSVVNTVVNASAPCAVHEHLPACVLGTPQPELQGNFVALTGFYVVSRFLGVQDRRTLDPLLDAAKTLCSRPWTWVQEHLGSNVNVERYCTWGPYVVKLLLHGLGLEEQHVYIAHDGDLGWPLGAVLVEASKLPGYSTAVGHTQRQHRKHGSKHEGSSLRGTGTVLPREPLTPLAAQDAISPAAAIPGGSPSVQADTVHAHTAASQEAGPAWSLGLLHHNQSSSGLHLSGPGWVVVLAVAWLVIVGWCRGVCGPKAAGNVALLPLAGMLSSTAGPGRAHVNGYIGRGKISPNRSSFKK